MFMITHHNFTKILTISLFWKSIPTVEVNFSSKSPFTYLFTNAVLPTLVSPEIRKNKKITGVYYL